MSEQVKILFRGQSTLQNKFVKCLIIFEKKTVTTSYQRYLKGNKMLNDCHNSFAGAAGILVHFCTMDAKQNREITKFWLWTSIRLSFT